MSVEIQVPSVGESISEVVVSQWLVEDGAYVEKDAPICELETDKINQELVAPEAGVIRRGTKEGETVPIGHVIGTIESGEKPAAPKEKEPSAEKKEAAPAATKQEEKPAPAAAPDGEEEELPRASSVAKKMAAEYGVDLGGVRGTGAGGRITKEDIVSHMETSKAAAKPAAPSLPPPPPRQEATQPSRPKVTVEEGHVERAITREKMSTLRKRVAQRLVEAQHTAAMLTTFNEVDMTAVMDARSKYKESFQKKHGVGLGFMSFFLRACVEALKEFPRINAYIENDEIVYHHYYDIGVAVGTERGLVVPVLRNVERMSFSGIEKTIRDFAERAKSGKLSLDDLSGGTFTVTNGGVYGSMMSTPILNPPQSGILGMHNIVQRPMAIDGEVKIRPMMYLALSYDHRIVDGKEAVSFLVRVKQCIEDPERMLLEV